MKNMIYVETQYKLNLNIGWYSQYLKVIALTKNFIIINDAIYLNLILQPININTEKKHIAVRAIPLDHSDHLKFKKS